MAHTITQTAALSMAHRRGFCPRHGNAPQVHTVKASWSDQHSRRWHVCHGAR